MIKGSDLSSHFLPSVASPSLVTSNKLVSNMSIYFSPQHTQSAGNYAIQPQQLISVDTNTLHLPPPNKESSDHHGCFACRWRKKRCKPIPGQACSDCARFNIGCVGAGLERPTVRSSLHRYTYSTFASQLTTSFFFSFFFFSV